MNKKEAEKIKSFSGQARDESRNFEDYIDFQIRSAKAYGYLEAIAKGEKLAKALERIKKRNEKERTWNLFWAWASEAIEEWEKDK